MTTSTGSALDRYYDLKKARDKARLDVTEFAQELRSLASDITDFEGGVRLNEPWITKAPIGEVAHIIGPERLPSPDRLANVLRQYRKAEDTFVEHEASLSLTDRRRLGLPMAPHRR